MSLQSLLIFLSVLITCTTLQANEIITDSTLQSNEIITDSTLQSVHEREKNILYDSRNQSTQKNNNIFLKYLCIQIILVIIQILLYVYIKIELYKGPGYNNLLKQLENLKLENLRLRKAILESIAKMPLSS